MDRQELDAVDAARGSLEALVRGPQGICATRFLDGEERSRPEAGTGFTGTRNGVGSGRDLGGNTRSGTEKEKVKEKGSDTHQSRFGSGTR